MEEKNIEVWNQILVLIKHRVDESSFKTWFLESKLIDILDDGTVRIGFPNELIKNWVSKKFISIVSESVRECIEDVTIVDFIIYNKSKKNKSLKKIKNVGITNLPISGYRVDPKSNLNTKYVFENFIQTPHNLFAKGYANTVVKKPGGTYNPYFVYGLTGVGKTHLIQSMGNEIQKRSPKCKVLYVTADKFREEYLNAISDNTIRNFKDLYYSCDVLIIDDIQFLAIGQGNATREQLHHVFNDLYNKNKQIIISSDEHPKNMDGFRSSLVSRFDNGLTTEIHPIDSESKQILIEKMLESYKIKNINSDIKNYLIQYCDPDIRSIEGKMKQIYLYIYEFKKNLSLEEFKKTIMRNYVNKSQNISDKDVISYVAKFYNIPNDILFKKTRKKQFVLARQVIMFLLREDLNFSYSEIGNRMQRDHTTVIHSCEKVKKSIKSEDKVFHEISRIRSGLWSHH